MGFVMPRAAPNIPYSLLENSNILRASISISILPRIDIWHNP